MIGGSTSPPTTSVAVIRTTPRTPPLRRKALRTSAAAAAAIASAWGPSASAAGVGVSRRRTGEQCRAELGLQRLDVAADRRLITPSRRAAPDRLPSRATSRKVRNSSQLGGNRPSHTKIIAVGERIIKCNFCL